MFDEEALSSNLVALHLDSPSLTTLLDLPEDLLQNILLVFSDLDIWGRGNGGLNVFRLVCKPLMRVVESCATRLTYQDWDGPYSFPLALRKCKRVEHIRSRSVNLRSLEGCPDRLTSLDVDGSALQNLEPLRECSELEVLHLMNARTVSDLRPLTCCAKIKTLTIEGAIACDLIPISSMSLLEGLDLLGTNVGSLYPLRGLTNLRRLNCCGIDRRTSLLPLASCSGLKELICFRGAVDLDELKSMLPELVVTTRLL